MDHEKKPVVPQPAPRPQGLIPDYEREDRKQAEQLDALGKQGRRIAEHSLKSGR